MKKIHQILIFCFLFLIFYPISFADYQVQGFDKINQNGGKLNFECSKQCFVMLDKFNFNDYLELKGNISGTGKFGYGFFDGKQIIPGEFNDLINSGEITSKFSFNKLQFYSQLPAEIPVVIVFDGKIKGEGIIMKLDKFGFGENIKNLWNDFWTNELLAPYSINLRYGVKLLGASIIKIFYIIFVLSFLIGAWFIDKKYRLNFALYLFLGLFLFIGTRNLITYSAIYNNGYDFKNNFYDLGDYLGFMDKIRSKLDLDNKNIKTCNIYFEGPRDWPFMIRAKAIYLRPCIFVDDIKNAQYAVYFKKEHTNTGELLINYNGNYFYKLNK